MPRDPSNYTLFSSVNELTGFSKKDEALALVAFGLRVFPVWGVTDGLCHCGNREENHKAGKHPHRLVPNGVKNASDDPDQIKAWWTAAPDANIGIDLKTAGLVVVGPDSVEWLEKFKARGLTPTITIQSGGGPGHEHYWYRLPEGCPILRSCKPGKYDIVADGYAMGTGSTHKSGGTYGLLVSPQDRGITHVSQLPEADQWVVEMLKEAHAQHTDFIEVDQDEPPVPLTTEALERWHGRVITKNPETGKVDRSGSLTRIAYDLGKAGLTRRGIVDALRDRDLRLWLEPKYAGRSDEDKRYAELADKALGPAPGSKEGERDDRLLTLPLTDLGNAERFALLNEYRAAWVEEWQCWLTYDGRRWNRQSSRQVQRFAKETIRTFEMRAAAMPTDNPLRGEMLAHGRRSESDRAINAMINQAKAELEARPEDFDVHPWLLNVANGTLDLLTFQLRPHDPADRITQLTDVHFDTDSRSDDWDRLIADITRGKAGLDDFLQRAAGYSICGDTREDKLFMLLGPSRSGKSTFVEAVKTAMGDYAETAGFDTFIQKRNDGAIREDIARLGGKRFVSSVEVDEGKTLAAALVKALTGGDTVTARFLYKGSFTFKPQAKLWLAANHEPRISSEDHAMWERVLRVPFDNVVAIDQRDLELKERLKDPVVGSPAILAWLVEGCRRWQQVGLQVPEVVTLATAAYREDMDPIRDFVNERLVVGEGQQITVTDMRQSYESWAKENGERFMPGRKKFTAHLESLGYQRSRISGGATVWLGLGHPGKMDNVSPFSKKVGT